MIPCIIRTRHASTDRWRATVRQSEINVGADPWPPALDVEDLLGKHAIYYAVRADPSAAVFQSQAGEIITVLGEEI